MPDGSGDRPSDELLTLQEVAAMLKVPVTTLRKWRTGGTAPRGFRLGKYVRFRRSSVEAFIREKESTE